MVLLPLTPDFVQTSASWKMAVGKKAMKRKSGITLFKWLYLIDFILFNAIFHKLFPELKTNNVTRVESEKLKLNRRQQQTKEHTHHMSHCGLKKLKMVIVKDSII